MKLASNHFGKNLLGIWLVFSGLLPLLTASAIAFNAATLLAVLAVAAGIAILLGK